MEGATFKTECLNNFAIFLRDGREHLDMITVKWVSLFFEQEPAQLQLLPLLRDEKVILIIHDVYTKNWKKSKKATNEGA